MDLITFVGTFAALAGLVFGDLPTKGTMTNEICVTVTNNNAHAVNLAWVAYNIENGLNASGTPNPGPQDLIGVFPFTIPAGSTRELCVPSFPCGQFDFIQWDLIANGNVELPNPYHFPGHFPTTVYGAVITSCQGEAGGTCRMTGGINLSTDQANLGDGTSTTLTANGGGFQIRSPSQGTSNLEIHLTYGGQTFNVKMDKDLTFFSCDDVTHTVMAVADATINGVSGYQLTVILTDNGEPGRDDTVSLLLTQNGTPVVWFTDETLNLGGNLQFHAH